MADERDEAGVRSARTAGRKWAGRDGRRGSGRRGGTTGEGATEEGAIDFVRASWKCEQSWAGAPWLGAREATHASMAGWESGAEKVSTATQHLRETA